MRRPWSEAFSVRPLAAADLDAVVRLEGRESSAWSRSQIEEEGRQARSVALAAVGGEGVIGWCCGRFLLDEAELLKICVDPGHRRHGAGTMLLRVLERRLQECGVTRVFLEVRSRNLPAVGFYRRAGFTAVGRRINYYSRPQDDALLFRKIITDNVNRQAIP